MLTSSGRVPLEQAELIVRVIAKEVDADRAKDALFRPIFGMLRRCCLSRLHNDDDAEDVLQETFERLVRHLDRFQGNSKFSTWCIGYVNNVAREHIRRQQRVRDYEVISGVGSNDDPDDLGDRVEAGEIEGYPDRNPYRDPEARARLNEYLNMLTDCQERICQDPKTEDPDLERCLTNGWIEALSIGAWATGQEIADACGSRLNYAYGVRDKLLSCMKAKLTLR